MAPRKGPTEIRPSLGGKSMPQGNRHAKDGAALLKTYRQLLASGYQGPEPTEVTALNSTRARATSALTERPPATSAPT